MRGSAVKALDLLQHAIELGNDEALFTMAEVSMVGLVSEALNDELRADVFLLSSLLRRCL